jgi:hypothetical protein
MNKPKIGKTYTFVRRREDTFEHTDFMRHEDGSSGFLVDGHYSIFECHLDAWQHALAALAELGFVELSEARKSGLVPADWHPTRETSTLHACRRPVTVTPISDDNAQG